MTRVVTTGTCITKIVIIKHIIINFNRISVNEYFDHFNLPQYVKNCFREAGFDDIEAITGRDIDKCIAETEERKGKITYHTVCQ